MAACETLFARWLDGHRLRSNAPPAAPPWTSFVRVRNRAWFHDRLVLIGDAAHTAHFSIGSGTKLAMEDAIALARVLAGPRPLAEALAEYQQERMTEALRLQNAARNSMEWFEHVERYIRLDARSVRLLAADAQPAGEPREPAAARPQLPGRRGAVVRARSADGWQRLRRCRCSRRSRCAA